MLSTATVQSTHKRSLIFSPICLLLIYSIANIVPTLTFINGYVRQVYSNVTDQSSHCGISTSNSFNKISQQSTSI